MEVYGEFGSVNTERNGWVDEKYQEESRERHVVTRGVLIESIQGRLLIFEEQVRFGNGRL